MGEFALAFRHPVAAPDGSTQIGIIGPITHNTSAELRNHLRLIIEVSSSPRLLLDLTCCTSINVDGMLCLSVAQHAAHNRGGDLRLVNVPRSIERQLRQHNFDDLLLDPTPDQH